MNLYNYLEWDTNFFGFKVAKINHNILNFNDLTSILDFLKKDNCRLIYWSVNPDNLESNNAAINNNGILIDEKITYEISLKNLNLQNNVFHPNISEYIYSSPNQELIDLAIQSGEYSRFKLDKKFLPNNFKNLYKIWIENSVSREIAELVLVYKINESISGMITLKSVNNTGLIGLMGVDKQFRGQKIGYELITAAKIYFFNKNYNYLYVVTQKKNLKSCKFYEYCGFKKIKSENFYHFWL